MAILESCCGSGLAVSSAVVGVYLLGFWPNNESHAFKEITARPLTWNGCPSNGSHGRRRERRLSGNAPEVLFRCMATPCTKTYLKIAYVIGFAIELWWILESPATPPIPAYLLCAGYFVLVVFSALLLHGLSTKRTSFLLVWLFMMGILLGPEAGLVLYLSIHYWRVTSLYGLIEVTCWACRLVVNATGLLCVQSLHSIWREEKSLLLRLETLNKTPASKTQVRGPDTSSRNPAHEANTRQEKAKNHPEGCFASPLCDAIIEDGHYAAARPFSEFHASSFDPAIIDARLESMPYLTIRKRGGGAVRAGVDEGGRVVRARSLMDLRVVGEPGEATGGEGGGGKGLDKGWDAEIRAEDARDSLDRKIIKNKNLKILRTLSPFSRTKPIEVNIYRINPPKESNWSNVDIRLKEIYANRGMYMFDEKLKKVVYYPPEVLSDSVKFRKRMDSYGSSQSRSSVETDSEDIRHISDVAL